MKLIHVAARRWFDKNGGNTYHSVAVTMPDGTVKVQGLTYGYGQQYEVTALGLVAGHEVAGKEIPWKWYEQNGYKVVYDVVDVNKKSLLHRSGE